MNDQLLKQIEDLGLSEKEAKVYVASLMLGPATVQQIAARADIKRVTTYVILESLSALGLVSQTTHGKKTSFTAEDPLSLRRLLDKKQREIDLQRKSFDALLPDLQELKSLPLESPTVKFYDTREGLQSVVSSFLLEIDLDQAEFIYGLSDVDKVQALFPEIAENHGNPTRIKAGKKSKLIYTSERGPIYKDTDDISLRESRHVPKDRYPINGDLTLVGDHILLLSLDGSKPFGVTIKSAALATATKALFDLAWQSAEHYQE